MKSKIKEIIQVFILISIMILGSTIVYAENIEYIGPVRIAQTGETTGSTDDTQDDVKAPDDGKHQDGVIYWNTGKDSEEAEIFYEYRSELNHKTHPTWLFAFNNISMWCVQHNYEVDRYMTSSEAHYWAFENKTVTSTENYDYDKPYAYYARTKKNDNNEDVISDGLWEKYEEAWKTAANTIATYHNYSGPGEYPDDDNQDLLDKLNASKTEFGDQSDPTTKDELIKKGMPGVNGNPKYYSIIYKNKETLDVTKYQHALFVLTQQHIYETANNVPDGETLTDDQKKDGWFNDDEKQAALWEIPELLYGEDNDKDDANLGEIANAYQKFYDEIHKNIESGKEDSYDKLVNAYYYDSNGNEMPADGKHIVEKKTTISDADGVDIPSGEYKTFEYKHNLGAKTQIDISNKEYTIGPFCIDFALDDNTKDIYEAQRDGQDPDAEIKFNAFQNIKIYNQDKKDIESLGGNFKLLYEDEQGNMHESKVLRINDSYYYTSADGKEITGFKSKDKFYIVVNRGNMDPKDFTGLYAKVDTLYLESLDGHLSLYDGQVWRYYYKVEDGKTDITAEGEYSTNCSTDPETKEHIHGEAGDCSQTVTINTHKYILQRDYYDNPSDTTGTQAQKMLGYEHTGTRTYKEYSFLIEYNIPDKTEFGIKLYKKCDACGDLFGAYFGATIDVNGKDEVFNTDISGTIDMYRYTDQYGLITISQEEIESMGIDLKYFTGEIKVTYHETVAPANHIPDKTPRTFTMNIKSGKMMSISGDNCDIRDKDGIRYAFVTINNEHQQVTPKIQIEKVNRANGELLSNITTYFRIHVSYTDENGLLVDESYNEISGQTKDGILKLTNDDFMGMRQGFSLTNYTGKVTLDITEIAVGTGFTILPQNKDITLKYEKGYLVDYTEYTDADVVAREIYVNPLKEIYNYAQNPYNYSNIHIGEQVVKFVTNWANEQHAKNPDMSYNEIFAWLTNYIENSYINNGTIERYSQLIDWRYATLTSEVDKDEETIRIVFEDDAGKYFQMPDLPGIPKVSEPFYITIAGRVFLDEHEDKAGKDSNGLYDEGEMLLEGIEVELRESNGKLATLVQRPNEIRTNPTRTNANGYYEFRGVDPFKKYYVVFKYNGMEFEPTKYTPYGYQSAEWKISSKGEEGSNARNTLKVLYGTIDSNTYAYDYDELEGLYEEIKNFILTYQMNYKQYPAWETIKNSIAANHSYDNEIYAKLKYIHDCEVQAEAGNGLYPNNITKFMSDISRDNVGADTYKFAGNDVNLISSGLLQINLGLVKRESTDLSLVSDIIDTTVSINSYDTTYDYDKGLSEYNQYIYKEDYDYRTLDEHKGLSDDKKNEGIAYYTEDNVHFYITYEIKIQNATAINTRVVEIKDYFNKEFIFNQNGYTTTKGNHIAGFSASIDGKVDNTLISGFGVDNNLQSGKYKTLTVRFNNTANLATGDQNANDLRIRLTFELVGNSNKNAKQILYDMLNEEGNTTEYARNWGIGNYAEITSYSTDYICLDRDSSPGTFDIATYEKYNANFQTAAVNYFNLKVDKNATEEQKENARREMNRWLGKLKEVQEDDVWFEEMILSNSSHVREITGNVWEAIKENVTSSIALQDPNEYVIFDESKDKYKDQINLEGIPVELVELVKDKDVADGINQIVRATTKTDKDGKYTFKSYIAGDYTIRFVYGGENNTINSKVSENANGKLPINGQYYQSTKANPSTDTDKYWYKERGYDENGANEIKLAKDHPLLNRYSDAYDDSYTRLSQMNSKIEGTEKDQTSSDYDYQGNIQVESTKHNDQMYAYTSTMELEIEYIRSRVLGNKSNSFYKYKINNIDFGVTPRGYNDVDINKYISNVKMYTQDGDLKVDANFNENGNVDREHSKIDLGDGGGLTDVTERMSPKEFITYLEYAMSSVQDAKVEITYKVKVTNNSEHTDKLYDTIKYIKAGNKTISVIYYNEELDKLVCYESDDLRKGTPTILYHNGDNNNPDIKLDDTVSYQESCMTGEDRNQTANVTGRLSKAVPYTGYTVDNDTTIITSQVTSIIDYVDSYLSFAKVNYKGENVNQNWDISKRDEYVTSRENYKVVTEADGEVKKVYEKDGNLVGQGSQVKYTNGPLYDILKPGDTREDNIVLFIDLGSQVAETNDYTYTNLVEIARERNIAGKINDIEGYDINGNETSDECKLDEMQYPVDYNGHLTPTLSTSKSPTMQLNTPAGLPELQNMIFTYIGIAALALIIFAIGIVLIKKFVIAKKEVPKE